MTNPCVRIVEFSTDFLPETDRISYWREHYGHVVLRADFEPARDVAFHACIASLSLPGLQLSEASSSPVRISRTGEYLADGNDDFVLTINRKGGIATISSGGREQILREQEALLLIASEPTSFCRTNAGQSFTCGCRGPCSVRLPRMPMVPSCVQYPEIGVLSGFFRATAVGCSGPAHRWTLSC